MIRSANDTANEEAQMNATKKSRKTANGKSEGFTAEEKAAMRERAKELKAEERWKKDAAAGEADVLEKIAEMPPSDRAMAERLHALIKKSAPALMPRTWYGMPAYANKDGKVVCFFRAAEKFKDRYATFGFNDAANLDEGNMWPTSFGLTKVTSAEEKQIAALVKRAVS
jgi:uncharacterized protein YdhG (YjbR/CyaY superfamily)